MYPLLFYQFPEIVPALVVGWSMLSDKNDMGLKQKWKKVRNRMRRKGWDDEMGIRSTEVENRIKFGGTA